ncbi:MAG: hypothetical protein HOM79_11545 [Alphaproteobacteria bacterium]|nr:hypothetical protein [Alphaproteobacteria bacterium]
MQTSPNNDRLSRPLRITSMGFFSLTLRRIDGSCKGMKLARLGGQAFCNAKLEAMV